MDSKAIFEREKQCFLQVAKRLPVALVRGKGSRVWDADGQEYIDLTAGWGVNAIGHAHPAMLETIQEQAAKLIQTTNFLYTTPQLDLAEFLAQVTPNNIKRSFFVSAGTEAMDGALKLAHRATGRTRFISTTGSFHGRSLGALRIIGQEKHRAPYTSLLAEPNFVPFGDSDAACAAINNESAAFIVEPVQGEGGVNVAPPGYLRAIRQRCNETGALLILDEIQTGMGRTGRWLACEHDAIEPDIITLGKGLGGGMPIAAFLCSETVANTVALGDHGGTYAGSPLTCAVAHRVLQVLREEKLVERAAQLGERLFTRLQHIASENEELFEAPRGRGLLLGLPLRDPERAMETQRQALQNGVIINVAGGHILRFFPALNIPEEDLFDALNTVARLATD